MNNPETDLDLDKLFLPAWAQQAPTVNQYAKYEGEPEPRKGARRRENRRGRTDRAVGMPPRRERPRPERGAAQQPATGMEAERRPQRGQREERKAGREQRPEPTPLPQIDVAFQPDEKGIESIARQIKMTGRAYPLFGIAQLILEKPERYSVTFSVRKKEDGQPVQPLFLCALDETLWLSKDEVAAHVLSRHFNTFYQAERTPVEPPKGKYTFVAQCGLSGVILGPPNHHDYQNQLRKLHAERFARMPFEVFKSHVKIVRDEAVVKKWIEDQSWRTEYVCLNVPEPLRFASREAVEKHFREVHLPNLVRQVDTHTLSGAAARSLRCAGLRQLVRSVCDEQKRFPLKMATVLSQQFSARGLQFFKVNRTVTHVSVARPRYLDLETTPVSAGVRRIIEFINSHPKCTRRDLIEALAPSPPPPVEQAAPQTDATDKGANPATIAEPTPEQTAVIADLHWLVHQGHVIEFANGTLETAKKPAPRPPKPETKPAETEPAAPAPGGETTPATTAEGVETAAAGTGEPPIPAPEQWQVTFAEGQGAGLELAVPESETRPVPGCEMPAAEQLSTPSETEMQPDTVSAQSSQQIPETQQQTTSDTTKLHTETPPAPAAG